MTSKAESDPVHVRVTVESLLYVLYGECKEPGGLMSCERKPLEIGYTW